MRATRIGVLYACLTSSATATNPPYANDTSPLPAHGNGTAYASACAAALLSYTSATSAWSRDHASTTTTTYTDNGSSVKVVTFYQDASTLCDGHARVPKSPAVALSSRTTTVRTGPQTTNVQTGTGWPNFPGALPSCRIKPADCDPLWKEYWSDVHVSRPQITPPPQTPPCWNSSFASSQAEIDSSLSGCGRCTIFGKGVQLVYFPVPTTVSRDMCATTPSASVTHYGSGAVITAYAGTAYSGSNDSIAGQKTAVVNGHTFTSGTAYISLASVWASDRCSSTHGPVINNAILAMPSESVLSLRYTQNHLQYFMNIETQTGYPVSYADFNEPVPYSAWNGQNSCRAADDGWSCQIIYDGMYRPQLAIPPGIRELSPDFANCQGWYNGLYDPPLALTEANSAAVPTLPGGNEPTMTAMPSSVLTVPTSAPTSGSGDPLPGSPAQSEVLEPTPSADGLSQDGSQSHWGAQPSSGSNSNPGDGHPGNDEMQSTESSTEVLDPTSYPGQATEISGDQESTSARNDIGGYVHSAMAPGEHSTPVEANQPATKTAGASQISHSPGPAFDDQDWDHGSHSTSMSASSPTSSRPAEPVGGGDSPSKQPTAISVDAAAVDSQSTAANLPHSSGSQQISPSATSASSTGGSAPRTTRSTGVLLSVVSIIIAISSFG